MPRKRQGRPPVVGLGGVVVHDVEDHLDPGRVQRLDHRLELADLAAALLRRRVRLVRGEEPDRVVTPVVGQPAGLQVVLGHELVHRHQLDRGDAQPGQVLDDRGMGDPGVGAPLLGRHVRVAQGQAADVRLVDDGLVVRDPRGPVVPPVEERVDDHVRRHVRRAVHGVQRGRVAEAVAEHRLVPPHLAVDGLAVRVEQQLGRVAAVPARGVVGAVHPVSVPLARGHVRQVAVPDERVDLGQRDTRLGEAVRLVRRRAGTVQPARQPRRTTRSSFPCHPTLLRADRELLAKRAPADPTRVPGWPGPGCSARAQPVGQCPERDPGTGQRPRAGGAEAGRAERVRDRAGGVPDQQGGLEGDGDRPGQAAGRELRLGPGPGRPGPAASGSAR